MAYATEHLVTVGGVKELATVVKGKLDETIKTVSVSGNTIQFFKTADGSGTAAHTVDFPSEFFLDQAKTGLVSDFVWSDVTYPGSTDPGLDGRPVLVMAVKGEDAQGTETVTYSFVDVESLIGPTNEPPVGAIVATGDTLPATGTVGDTFLNTADGKLYSYDDTGWSGGAPVGDGARFASSTDKKIYVVEGGKAEGYALDDGIVFFNRMEDSLWVYSQGHNGFLKVGGATNAALTPATQEEFSEMLTEIFG